MTRPARTQREPTTSPSMQPGSGSRGRDTHRPLDLPQRYKGALLIVGSVGLLVGALMIPLSSYDSVRGSLTRSADPARVVIRAAGRPSPELTRLPDGIASLVSTAPGIARDATGAALIDAESLRPIDGLIKRNNGKEGYTVVAGVGPQWGAMRPSFRLLTGRMPQPGSREMIVGTLARQKFSGLDDESVRYRDTDWRGGGHLCDGRLVGRLPRHQRHGREGSPSWSSDSAVRVRLTSPGAFESFRSAVALMLPPSVIVERETDFYAAFWQMVPRAMVWHRAHSRHALRGRCGGRAHARDAQRARRAPPRDRDASPARVPFDLGGGFRTGREPRRWPCSAR